MKKILIGLGLLGALALTGPALAVEATPSPTSTTLGVCNPGWYVNGDETDRKPTPTKWGLKFEASDLIHHAATGTVEGLTKGTFELAYGSPAPDQPSFFSVEVGDGTAGSYATLRWDTTENLWIMVTGGQVFKNATASGLVAMTTPPKSTKLISFGIGYTKNPPGTKAAVVKSVTFRGTKYDLRCTPKPSSSSVAPTQTPTTQPPTLPPTATSSASGTGAPVITGGGGELALTGFKTSVAVGSALVLIAAGVALFVGLRRRRVQFEA